MTETDIGARQDSERHVLSAELDDILSNPIEHQEATLRKILQDNASCEYLQMHGLGGRTDIDSFRECVPIVEYQDVEPFILRIADGDTSPILFTYAVRDFGLSSGTSGGKSKMIPMTHELYSRRAGLHEYGRALLERAYPECNQGMVLSFTIAGKQFETKSGHKVGTISTNACRNKAYRETSMRLTKMTSPVEVVLCSDSPQAIYCHLLCGLLQSQKVRSIESTFAFLLAEAFRMLEQWWQEICNDLRTGKLSSKITDVDVRMAVSALLEPQVELADAISRECSKGWHGIICRLFPNAIFLSCHATGPVMRPYISCLNYYSGDLPIVMRGYSATEGGRMGLNMNLEASPHDVVYTLLPSTVFFEFIPIGKELVIEGGTETFFADAAGHDHSKGTLKLHELEVDRFYEIVITSCQGLYRYRLGDVLRVTGFQKGCPMVEYMGRRNVLLGINTDKTDEVELEILMSKAGELLEEQQQGMEVVEYTSHADHSIQPGHYVIYWELKDESGVVDAATMAADEALQQCCNLVDSLLNNPYLRGRKAGTIGALELRVVSTGTFAHLMECAVNQGAAPAQYKPPRCIVSPLLVQHLNDRVLANFFSTVTSWNV